MTNPESSSPTQGPGPDQAGEQRSTLRRYALPAALVIGGVTAGSFFAPVGLASAQEDTDDQSDDTSESDNDSESETDDDADADVEDGNRRGHGPRGGHGHRGWHVQVDVLTDILGLDAEELRAAFADGKSLADIAAEQGVDVEELSAALVSAAEERIDEAVADGALDAERAEEMKAGLSERIDEHINNTPSERADGEGPRGRRGVIGGRGDVGAELAEFLGLDSEELRAAFAEGKSLADVAAEQNVSEDDLVGFLMGQLEERLDQAVADEKLDADRAEQLLEDAEERIQDHIDDVPGDRAEHGVRGGRGHHGGQGSFDDDSGSEDESSDTGVTNNTSFQA